MAGAGYKLFNTGDVLTAAQVNTYLMEQTVMVFADASARTTALTGVVAEGMISFLKDTNSTEYYSGSAWVAVGGSVPTSLEFTAGKNKIINGDFSVNQRGFTSTTTTGTYGFDRWSLQLSGATGTYSAQTFTLGAAPVAGYEARNFARLVVTTGNDNCALQNRMESVRTFAGQTVTLSFWAKGTNPTTEGGLYATLAQVFGSGGSPSAVVNTVSPKIILTADWTRYSFTLNIPSISGKILGTAGDDFLALVIGQGTSISTDSYTLDLWGVQVEAGSTATAFQTATGTLQGELAACQRYYYRATFTTSASRLGSGFATAQTTAHITFPFPTEMRIRPTALEQSGTAGDYSIVSGSSTSVCDNVPAFVNATFYSAVASFSVPSASLTVGNGAGLRNVNTNAYLGWSSEL